MCFRVNLKWKSQHCDGVLHNLFIKLNVTVAFLLIMKTWDELFAGKVEDGDFKKWGGGGNPSNGWWFGKGGGDWYSLMDYDSRKSVEPRMKPSGTPALTRYSCEDFHLEPLEVVYYGEKKK